MRKEGIVKWFDARKGFGFIHAEPGMKGDIFVYYDQIDMDGFKTLKTGQRVSYELHETDKGLQAKKVVIVQ